MIDQHNPRSVKGRSLDVRSAPLTPLQLEELPDLRRDRVKGRAQREPAQPAALDAIGHHLAASLKPDRASSPVPTGWGRGGEAPAWGGSAATDLSSWVRRRRSPLANNLGSEPEGLRPQIPPDSPSPLRKKQLHASPHGTVDRRRITPNEPAKRLTIGP